MKRREFVSLLGGAVAAWPLAARAQPAKMPTVGFLGAPEASAWNTELAAFVQRLHELGWVEDAPLGLNVVGARALATVMPTSRPS